MCMSCVTVSVNRVAMPGRTEVGEADGEWSDASEDAVKSGSATGQCVRRCVRVCAGVYMRLCVCTGECVCQCVRVCVCVYMRLCVCTALSSHSFLLLDASKGECDDSSTKQASKSSLLSFSSSAMRRQDPVHSILDKIDAELAAMSAPNAQVRVGGDDCCMAGYFRFRLVTA